MAVQLRAPDDFHVHLRQPPLLAAVTRETARWFARALVMPNTVPPVTTPGGLREYRDQILAALSPGEAQRFTPLMTFKVVPEVDPLLLADFVAAGAVGGKLYPRGVTTNSADGVDDVEPLYPLFEAMEAHDLVLEIHAESPGIFSLERESAYLPTIERLAVRFPGLRMVIEHVSSAATIAALANLPRTVAATVTVHHLLLTLDDVVGGELRPHHFCKPIAKRPADREAIADAVLSGNPRVFFGSDSAPHPRGDKEGDCGCAGIYTVPVAVPLLADYFERAGVPLAEADACHGGVQAAPSLEAFVSRHGAAFYRLPLNEGQVTLADDEWVVPDEYAGVVPFYAGARLRYRLEKGES